MVAPGMVGVVVSCSLQWASIYSPVGQDSWCPYADTVPTDDMKGQMVSALIWAVPAPGTGRASLGAESRQEEQEGLRTSGVWVAAGRQAVCWRPEGKEWRWGQHLRNRHVSETREVGAACGDLDCKAEEPVHGEGCRKSQESVFSFLMITSLSL